MEKRISDDHHQESSSSRDRRPSLKIKIRISPEMMKQLRQQEEKEAKLAKEESVKEIDVKSEEEEEEEEEEVVVTEVKELIQVHQEKQQLVDCSSSSSWSFQLKLEATKRKFHDTYQQIANAKRQRRIQVIDPWDIPPQARGKGTSKLAGGAKSRLNMILSKKKKNNNLFSANRSTLMRPSYIC